ncbi:hypothetical protein CRE_07771 [Caenorhabditis remanei]|uniref:BRCT domain-containing protein n=1 Tax=Caenorhabditis remanei TaxID=31234 RepID=E3N6T0_CAERE|nr:hypothetical protein CRE_07771 [Caenorhabditis remanei]
MQVLQNPAYQNRRMYQMHKFFLVVFVFLPRSHIGSTVAAEPSLTLIYNELSIIARITNAIALRAGSIRKDLKPRDVITELLKTHSKSFEELIEYDPKKLHDDLQSVFYASSDVFDNPIEIGKRIKEIKDINLYLGGALKAELPINIADLMQTFQDENFKNRLTICNKATVETIRNFYSVMNNEQDLQDGEQKTIAIQTNAVDVKNCLNSIKDYEKIVATTRKVTDKIGNILFFNGALNYFNGNIHKIKIFDQSIIYIKKLLRNVGTNWKKPQLSEKILKISPLLETISDHENKPTPNLSAGFPGDDDLAKISEDVKSPWFQKEISKGKSTKDLEEALEPFGEFAKKLGDLRKSWAEFDEKVDKDHPSINLITESLKNIEDFSILDTGESFLKNAAATHQNTWKSFETFDTSKFSINASRAFLAISTIATSAKEIREWCTGIVGSYDFITLHHVLDEIGGLQLSSTNLDENKKAIGMVENFQLLNSFFGELETLSTSQNNFYYHHSLLTQIDLGKTMNDAVTIMKSSSLHKKLHSTNYDTNKLEQILTFLQHLLYFTDKNAGEKAMDFFKIFEKMKKNYLELEKFVYNLGAKNSELIVNFKNSTTLSQTFGRGLRVFRDISRAYQLKKELLESTKYAPKVDEWIYERNPHEHLRDFWNDTDRPQEIQKLIDRLENLEKTIKKFVSKDFETLREALNAAAKVTGIDDFRDGFQDVADQLSKPSTLKHEELQFALENSRQLADLDLDFSSHTGDLMAASMSFDNIRVEFNTMFGLAAKNEKTVKNAWLIVVLISICVFILLVIGALLIYGLTERGRNQYKNLYLFYIGKPEDFEKRWRYSLFMDRKDGKNALMDATREIHAINVKKEVKRGAYINVFTGLFSFYVVFEKLQIFFPAEFGNTPLHLSTKRGYAEIVEVLIKNGADRSLLNYQNRTPEQMIPENYQETHPEKVEKYKKIEAIYKKYRNKKFRKRVPQVFPSSSFHIYTEDKADIDLTNDFMDKFMSIVTPTLIPATTHVIVKTDSDGVLEIDGFEYLTWIMNGVIIVKESWMTDCLKNPKLIEKDSKYLVEKVRFKDVEYDTVTQWSKAMAKGEMPYLFGVYVCIVMKEQKNVFSIASIVNAQGGTMCEGFPLKENYNIGSHPYLHAHLGPLFVITDGSTDLTLFKNDSDKMYTFFTEDEFVHFLLKREINIDTKLDPIQATKESDD